MIRLVFSILILCVFSTSINAQLTNWCKSEVNPRDCSQYFVFDVQNDFVTKRYCPYGKFFDPITHTCSSAQRIKCPAASDLGKICKTNRDCLANSGLSCSAGKCKCASKTRYWSIASNKCSLCPDGWVNRLDSCYFVSTHTLTGTDARQWCKAHFDSKLAIINDQAEFDYIIGLTYIQDKYFWIGLNDLKKPLEFVWDDDRPASQYELENWFPAGQIQDAYNRGFDGCVNTDSFYSNALNNWICSDASNFLCELKINQ